MANFVAGHSDEFAVALQFVAVQIVQIVQNVHVVDIRIACIAFLCVIGDGVLARREPE